MNNLVNEVLENKEVMEATEQVIESAAEVVAKIPMKAKVKYFGAGALAGALFMRFAPKTFGAIKRKFTKKAEDQTGEEAEVIEADFNEVDEQTEE